MLFAKKNRGLSKNRKASRKGKKFRMEKFEERTMFTACTGDLTGDYEVGFEDFLELSEQFGQEVAPPGTGADFDGNGQVGFGDFLQFSDEYGKVCEPDLVVRDLSIQAVTTDAVFYNYTITNVGDAPANMDGPTNANPDNVSVQAFFSADQVFNNAGDQPAGGSIISAAPLGDLMPGESVSRSRTVSIPFNANTHPYLTIKADWGDSLAESNESNNTAAAKIVSNEILDVRVRADNPEHLPNGENINVEFDYMMDVPEGVRIFARPMTEGARSLSYGAHGSPVHTDAIGTGSGFFTIQTENLNVDQVRVQMWTADQSELLDEMFVDVDIDFGYEDEIFNVEFDVAQDKWLDHGERINLSFDYTTDELDGVRIFARPMSNGALAPNYGAHSSPIHMSSEGEGTGFFTINSGFTQIDQVRLQMWNADQSELLTTEYVDVNYTYGLVLIPLPGVFPELPELPGPGLPELVIPELVIPELVPGPRIVKPTV